MTEKITLKYTLEEGCSYPPRRAHPSDAGIDLYACLPRPIIIPSKERFIIPTGVRIEIPEGYFGLIKDRSGWAAKKGAHVLAGVVDAGYRGEIKVVLCNCGEEPLEVKPGDRIAQIIIIPIPQVKLQRVSELSSSERGERGFGSTGF